MGIDSIAPATAMDRSCSATGANSGDGERCPAGHGKKVQTTEQGAVCLKKLLREASPEFLNLSLTDSSASEAAEYRRKKRPVEVSLAYVNARRDYLSLKLSDQPKRRRRRRSPDVSSGCGSVVMEASSVASSGAVEGALVVVESVIPPPPVQIPATCLPPKKRNLAAACVPQETAGTAPASSSRCLALAIVNHNDGVSRPPSPLSAGGDGETRSPATMASHPIYAVPLQAVLSMAECLARSGCEAAPERSQQTRQRRRHWQQEGKHSKLPIVIL